ncbi:ATP-grasp domain-containing protein [Rhodovibrionaceae bacterium A322]
MSKIHVLHENAEWLPPLRSALEARGQTHEEWHLDKGQADLGRVPPKGVFYNRMSASSHTRGHRYAPEITRAVLQWLELQGRRVINGTSALALEVDKLGQYAALTAAGIPTPKTVAATGKEQVLQAAREFGQWPLILKPNRGGKGLGVQLFQNLDSLDAFLDTPGDAAPIDGIWLLQSYVQAPEPFITRMEFIGGKLHYAVRVDTSEGFLLCPADVCEIPKDAFCLADSNLKDTSQETSPAPKRHKFEIVENFESPLVAPLEAFLAANGIEVAGIEFIVDAMGNAFVYDINTNTNYNGEAENRAKDQGLIRQGGMERLAEYLEDQLQQSSPALAAE